MCAECRRGSATERRAAPPRPSATRPPRATTCVPPTQRSIPSSATRSALAASTRGPPLSARARASSPPRAPRRTGRRLDEPRSPRPSSRSARKTQVSPWNGASSAPACEERLHRRARAVGEHLQQLALGAREAVADAGQLLEEAPERRPRGTAARRLAARRAAASARGSRRATSSQTAAAPAISVAAHGRPLRPERLELVGGQLTEPAEAGPAGERADLDELERLVRRAAARGRARARRAAAAGRRGRARTRARPAARRASAPSSSSSRARNAAASDRLRRPSRVDARNAARALEERRPRRARQRPLVQDVAPRQHARRRATCCSSVLRGAVAVRDVQRLDAHDATVARRRC